MPLLLEIFCPDAPRFKMVFPISSVAGALPVLEMAMAPPCNGHSFPASVLLLIITGAGWLVAKLTMPPPANLAKLPLRVLLLMVSVPAFAIPPP